MISKDEEAIQNSENTTPPSQGNFFVDFVLVGEFSELDGPVPLFVIPDGASHNFNLNEFVVRIMAVDYQNKPTDVTNSAQDTQVVLSEPKEKAFAYIHHFTLLDINARGYVRPICMGFITRDPKKVMNYFTDLMEEFNKVSTILKDGNRSSFLKDLETKIADVMYTQERLLKQDIPSDVPISGTPGTISEIMEDLRGLYKKVTKKEDEQLSPRLDADDDLLLEQSLKNMGYKPKLITSFYKSNYYSSANKNSLRTISDLCGEDVYSKAVSKLRKIQSHFFRPNILLALEKEDHLALSPSASLLSCGNTVLLNFNIEADRFIRNMDLELKALSPINKTLSKSVSNVSFKSSSSNSSSYASPASTMSDPPIIPNEDDNTNTSVTPSNPPSAPLSPSIPHLNHHNNNNNNNEQQIQIQLNNNNNNNNNLPSSPPEIYGNSSMEGEEALSSVSTDSLNVLRMQALMWPKTSPYTSISRVNLECFAGILWGYSKTQYGRGLLELRSRYSYLKHILYALLKGRPLIIYAHPTNESLVRKLVVSLGLFVSGHCRKQPSIMPWLSKPLKMSDLASLKLIGYSKQKPIPKAIEKYVCKLDFESETYIGPSYSQDSKVIEDILSTKKQWPDEDTYLAYIHYLLYDLAMKSCLYYHLCCISHPSNNIILPVPSSSSQPNSISNNNNNNTFLYQTLPNPTTNPNATLSNPVTNSIPSSGSLQMRNSSRFEYDKRSLSDSQLSLKVVSNSISQSREEAKFSFFKRLNFTKCDTEIIEYLAEVVKEQQSLEIHGPDQVTPVIHLDYSPVTQFQNQLKSNVKKPL